MIKKLQCLIIVLAAVIQLNAQDYQITFAILGNSENPDSINVLNTNTKAQLTLSGADILHLTDTTTGIFENSSLNAQVKIYPNPVTESATIQFTSQKQGHATIQITDIKGSIATQQKIETMNGQNSFMVSGLSKGTYIVNILTLQTKVSAIIISQINSGLNPTISSYQNSSIKEIDKDLKWNKTLKSMQFAANPLKMHYTTGDNLNFTAYLNSLNTSKEIIPTQSKTITFDFTLPEASFIADKTTIAAKSNVSFTNNSTDATQYSWIFDGATPAISSTESPTVNYPIVGMFSVTLQAINSLTTDTLIKTNYITVGELPAADFSVSDTTVKVDSIVTFTDATQNNPTSWLWTFGDGNTSTSQNPTYSYSTAGTYSISLEATNAFGVNNVTKEKYITVIENGTAPVADFEADITMIVLDSIITFTDLSENNPTAWNWSFGQGSISTDQNPTFTYTTPGNYTVTLQAINDFGNDEVVKTNYITVGKLPIAAFKADAIEVEVNTMLTFTDTSLNSPIGWLWHFGDGVNSNLQNPTHIYTAPDTYTVSLSIANNFGENMLVKTNYITVTAPTPSFYLTDLISGSFDATEILVDAEHASLNITTQTEFDNFLSNLAKVSINKEDVDLQTVINLNNITVTGTNFETIQAENTSHNLNVRINLTTVIGSGNVKISTLRSLLDFETPNGGYWNGPVWVDSEELAFNANGNTFNEINIDFEGETFGNSDDIYYIAWNLGKINSLYNGTFNGVITSNYNQYLQETSQQTSKVSEISARFNTMENLTFSGVSLGGAQNLGDYARTLVDLNILGKIANITIPRAITNSAMSFMVEKDGDLIPGMTEVLAIVKRDNVTVPGIGYYSNGEIGNLPSLLGKAAQLTTETIKTLQEAGLSVGGGGGLVIYSKTGTVPFDINIEEYSTFKECYIMADINSTQTIDVARSFLGGDVIAGAQYGNATVITVTGVSYSGLVGTGEQLNSSSDVASEIINGTTRVLKANLNGMDDVTTGRLASDPANMVNGWILPSGDTFTDNSSETHF